MPTQTRTQAAWVHATTNPDSASAVDLCHAAALVSLGTARRSPSGVNNFRSFSAYDEPDLDKPDDFNPSGNDPGDDGPGDDRPGDDPDNDNEEPLPEDDVEPGVTVLDNLTKAIELLTCNARTGSESSSRTKLRELDTFDGTDPKKLHTFLIQSKVTFMQSFLKGMALKWFKPDLLGTEDLEDQPYWMDSWKEFLDHLQMKDNHQVNKYMVKFNWLASQVWGYSDGALCHFFYTGLPDRIKDEVCWVGKPRTLHELQHLAQEIDMCYWECKEEIQCSSKHQGLSSGNKSTPNSSHSNQSKPGQEKSKTGNNSRNSNSGNQTQSKPTLTGQTGSNTPKPDSNKLGKDGKLTPEECKHCRDNNLCMFCGGTGHFADKCPKKAGKAKAHTAATSEAALASTSGSAPEAKK
ncbi:hypothetical protein M404DRAFT_32860 [Pisolithus tinctorius Marx 270]|uniref:CCHC-type domain-containing protein n=1 Tax=Pisolithus tinctorius Marx 270 TaxID=870435 RepID=A0A0C3JGW8_PISTI|nr:hypothetical protein M404DRAFT_32860 [Pisolithus tinctorius Marx 270]